MAIFAQIKNDPVVQLCDCVRFDVSNSVVSKPDDDSIIDTIEIAPDGVSYVEIKASGSELKRKEWFLDWVYEDKMVVVLDDYSDDSADSSSILTTVLDTSAQSYQPTVDKAVIYYETHARISAGTPVGAVVVDLYDGLPNGAGGLLGTSDPIDFADLPADNTSLTRFNFSASVSVVTGQDYYFQLRLASTDAAGTIGTFYPASDHYPNGNRWVSSDGGASFTSQSNDVSFIVGSEVEATDGIVNPSIRITATDGRIITKTSEIQLLTEAEDNLFTNDQDLVSEENDILSWLPDGRSSFTWIHRRVRDRIFSWLDERGWRDCDGNKYTQADVFDMSDFKEWSRFMALRMIFNLVYNARGDVYLDKYNDYCNKEKAAANREFKLDRAGDGVYDKCQDDVRTDTAIIKRG